MQAKKKFTAEDNTVCAVGQMRHSKVVSYLGNPHAAKRLLIVGNSITRHGPLAEIGWERDWGMAASAEERDYVHLLTSKLLEKEDMLVMVRQFASWEREYLQEGILDTYLEAPTFMADEIVFRLGENVKNPQNDQEEELFLKAVLAFIEHINPKGGTVYFTTCFWKKDRVDSAIRRAAHMLSMPLIELGHLGEADENMAVGLFEHNGVAHHPGDLGMERIAELIFRAMRA